MRSPQHETNIQPKSHQSQAETENLQPDVLPPIHPLLAQVGSIPNPTAHAAMLQRSPANPHAILQLQRQYGNRYVNRVLQQSQSSRSMPIQAKLTLGAVGDKYEQEADLVAKQVVNQINTPVPQSSTQSQPIQRQEIPEEDDELMMKPESVSVQRMEIPEEDDDLQMKPVVQRLASEDGGALAPDLETSIQQARVSGQPLAESVREPMERAFGTDFRGVRVHTDATSDQLNRSIQAKAFTTGQDVFFRQGAYQPRSRGGQELIAHELTHVVQQSSQIAQPASNKQSTTVSKTSTESLQRKTNNFPQANALTNQAPEGVFGGGNYESVITSLRDYHNNGKTPNDDHGKQILKLEEISTRIGNWELKHGSTNQPVNRGFFGLSKQDKRRQVLNNLKAQIPTEDTAVKQQGLTQADQTHQQDRTQLKQYVQNGLASPDRRLKNSCEWIQAGKTILYAVTPTGDSYARLIKAGKNPDTDEAFFPEGKFNSPGDINSPVAISYKSNDLKDNANVTLDKTKRVEGWNDPGNLGNPGLVAIVNPADKTQERVWETLRHEVQHDADKHKERDSLAGYRRGAEDYDPMGQMNQNDLNDLGNPDQQIAQQALQNLEQAAGGQVAFQNAISLGQKGMKAANAEVNLSKYKTEYRAYSYQEGKAGGLYSSFNNTRKDQNDQGYMFTARQHAIFKHIYGGYEHTKKGWDDNPTLADGATKFRDAVVAYYLPDTEGFNKYNSARVDNFYRALDAIGAKTPPTRLEQQHGLDAAPVMVKRGSPNNIQVKALISAINALDRDDADYILNESPAMMEKIKNHLTGQALQDVLTELQELETGNVIVSMFD